MLRFIAVKDRSQPVVMDRSFSGLSFPRVKDRDQWSGLFPVQSGPVCGLFAVLGPDLQTLVRKQRASGHISKCSNLCHPLYNLYIVTNLLEHLRTLSLYYTFI